MKKILASLMLFLILNSGCASQETITAFNAQWEFVEITPGITKACLDETDVGKLREILIRCEGKPK